MTTRLNNRMIDGAAVNVRDFGAVGDGVTDDTAAIQAAFDSEITILSGVGTFRISGPITNDVEREIKDMSFISASGTVAETGLHTTAALRATNCKFNGMGAAIVVDSTIDYLYINDCTFINHEHFAVGVESTNTTVNIPRIRLTNNGLQSCSYGFDLSCGYTTCQVLGNTFQYFNNGAGAGAVRIGQFTSVTRINCQVNDNIIQDITSYGGTGSTFGIQVLDARVVTVNDNALRTLDNDDSDDCEGIYIRSIESINVSGNALSDAAAREGMITLKGGIVNCVSNTLIQSDGFNKAPGISVQAVTAFVSSNLIKNPTNAAIWINNNVEHLTVSDNYCYGLKTSAESISNTENAFIYSRLTNPNSTRFVIKGNTFEGPVQLLDTSRTTCVMCLHAPATLYHIEHNTFNVLDGVTAIMTFRGTPNNALVFSNTMMTSDSAALGIQVGTTGGLKKLHAVGNYYNGFTPGQEYALSGTPPTDLQQLQEVIT